MKKQIFIVEDEASLQQLYNYALENEFNCFCFSDGKSFFEKIAENKPDLIILDVMLPGEDGFDILKQLKNKKKTSHIPVIMVSAMGDEISKVKGLNMGADDYMAKPFGVLELVARIKANLRKNTEKINEIIFKDININLLRHEITVSNTAIHTTLKEFNLLFLLCKNANEVQERDKIFNEVWGESFMGETRTLDIHIKELRRKLAEAGSSVEIKTIRGVGYILT